MIGPSTLVLQNTDHEDFLSAVCDPYRHLSTRSFTEFHEGWVVDTGAHFYLLQPMLGPALGYKLSESFDWKVFPLQIVEVVDR